MEMIAVEGVGVGSEPHLEAAAAGIVHRPKEAADVLLLAVPAGENCDPPSVGEDEGADVDRIRTAVLAQPSPGLAVDQL
jgi:hypothetical protein